MNALAIATRGNAERALAASVFATHPRQIERHFRARLTTKAGVEVKDLAQAISGCDVVFVLVCWGDPPELVAQQLAAAASRASRPRIVFLDWFDQSSTPFVGVLPHVDLYAKRQVLTDRAWYHEQLAGGYAFTDFLHHRFGLPLDGWSFGAPALTPDVHKIVTSWNFGGAACFQRLLRLRGLLASRWTRRDIDVHARFEPPQHCSRWYSWYRRSAGQLLAPLQDDLSVTPRARVPRVQYMRELRRSRMVFSPFGWGEVCFRDFEAVCFGCTLIKPAMSHLTTSPELYIPYETYIPVRWDLADLERTIRTYLERPDECRRIADQAVKRYLEYFRAGGVLGDLQRLMNLLDCPPQPVDASVRMALPWRTGSVDLEGQGLSRFTRVRLQSA